MTRQQQDSRTEMSDPILENRGRNLRGYNVGAAKVTAKKGSDCGSNEYLMEAVVERENMTAAYCRVRTNVRGPISSSSSVKYH